MRYDREEVENSGLDKYSKVAELSNKGQFVWPPPALTKLASLQGKPLPCDNWYTYSVGW